MSARILSLDEVLRLTIGDSVYIEVWGKINRHARFLTKRQNDSTATFSVDLYHVGKGGRYKRTSRMWLPAYNCSWRCWDKEPSITEMANAPKWEYATSHYVPFPQTSDL